MNMKMKTLSLAVLGIVGFAAAGIASAACVPGNLSAWSSNSAVGGTLTVATGGLETTGTPSECRLDATVTAGFSAGVFVRDDTPANEARYRAQFLLDSTGATSQTISHGYKVFGASATVAANGLTELVRLSVIGDVTGTGARTLGVFTVCAGNPGNICSGSVPLAVGVNRIEIDWVKGATGSLKVWVNNGTEGSPNLTLTGNSSAWGGVDFAGVGLIAPTPAFKLVHLNKIIKLDRFDSRRQTFIGL